MLLISNIAIRNHSFHKKSTIMMKSRPSEEFWISFEAAINSYKIERITLFCLIITFFVLIVAIAVA
jgi:hypothetical protein